VYEATDVVFDTAGVWVAEVTADVEGLGPQTAQASFAVQEHPSLPAPGDRAQPTENLTVDSKGVPLAAIDSRADAGSFFARWQPAASSWQLRADAGVTRHYSTFVSPSAPQRTIVNGGLRVSGNLARPLSIGLLASRAPFDETALLIANGVVSSEFAGEAELALPARFTLSGAASHARLTGGARDNSRNAYSSTLRWVHNRRWSLAVGARQFGYDTTSADGYFAPKRYTLAEVSGRGRLGGELGWNAEGDLGIGQQSIEFFGSSAGSRSAERVSLTAGYRFDPTHELSASGGYANVAAPGQTGGSEYKYRSFSLRARVGF